MWNCNTCSKTAFKEEHFLLPVANCARDWHTECWLKGEGRLVAYNKLQLDINNLRAASGWDKGQRLFCSLAQSFLGIYLMMLWCSKLMKKSKNKGGIESFGEMEKKFNTFKSNFFFWRNIFPIKEWRLAPRWYLGAKIPKACEPVDWKYCMRIPASCHATPWCTLQGSLKRIHFSSSLWRTCRIMAIMYHSRMRMIHQ